MRDLLSFLPKFNTADPVIPAVLHRAKLAADQALMTVYVMKSSLKAIWSAPTAWAWRTAWKEWMNQAAESGIAPLMSFAKGLSG